MLWDFRAYGQLEKHHSLLVLFVSFLRYSSNKNIIQYSENVLFEWLKRTTYTFHWTSESYMNFWFELMLRFFSLSHFFFYYYIDHSTNIITIRSGRAWLRRC